METSFASYPAEVFYLVAALGIILLLFRPRWAFLLIVFCLTVRNFHMAVFTRSELFGKYLNLNDLCLWIGVLAMVRVNASEGHRIWIPRIIMGIIGILVLGDIQSISKYGPNFEIMQSCWGSWIFPIMFIIAVNMVKDVNDACLFYWVLFLGSVGAALQHIFYMQNMVTGGEQAVLAGDFIDSGLVRTISFMSGGIFLVISLFFVDVKKFILNHTIFIFWIIGVSLITISYILNFTRTVWVGAIMALLSLCVLFYKEREKFMPGLGYSLIMLVAILIVFKVMSTFILPGVNIEGSISRRADFVTNEDIFEEAYETREAGMETELGLWKNGSIVWGVGASYPPSLINSSLQSIGALNHVAFSSYLAHFGLIGIIIYGFLLPFLTIKIGKRYYLMHKQDFGGAIAVAAMALAFFDFFTLLSSNHYLVPTGHVQGLLYGGLWGLSRSFKFNFARNYGGRIINHQPQQYRFMRPVL